jgi:hypothetical protein
MTKGNKLYRRYMENGKLTDEPLQKVNRYYVSKKGDQLIKKLPPLDKSFITATDLHKQHIDKTQISIFDIIKDDIISPKERETNIEAKHFCTMFNQYFHSNDYNIDYRYYIGECNKIIKKINSMEDKELCPMCFGTKEIFTNEKDPIVECRTCDKEGMVPSSFVDIINGTDEY